MQTHGSPVFATSVSVSSVDPCLDDSVGHVLLVSSILSDSYNLSSASSAEYPDLRGRKLMETSSLDSASE